MAEKLIPRERARDYFRAHPDASIADVAKMLAISERTAATARRTLVLEGVLPAGRHAPVPKPLEQLSLPNVPAPDHGAAAPGTLLTGADLLAADDEDIESIVADEKVRKRMLKQAQSFVFDPNLHADTRLSAMQVWTKIKEAARDKERGPGDPVTREGALERLNLMHEACDIALSVDSIIEVFGVGAILKYIDDKLKEGSDPCPTNSSTTSSPNSAATPATPA